MYTIALETAMQFHSYTDYKVTRQHQFLHQRATFLSLKGALFQCLLFLVLPVLAQTQILLSLRILATQNL